MAVTLSPAERSALQALRERVAAALGGELVRMELFGSRARGEGHEQSDLDVLVVVGTANRAVRRQVLDIAADLDEQTGLRLSPVVVDALGLAAAPALAGAVAREGIPL